MPRKKKKNKEVVEEVDEDGYDAATEENSDRLYHLKGKAPEVPEPSTTWPTAAGGSNVVGGEASSSSNPVIAPTSHAEKAANAPTGAGEAGAVKKKKKKKKATADGGGGDGAAQAQQTDPGEGSGSSSKKQSGASPATTKDAAPKDKEPKLTVKTGKKVGGVKASKPKKRQGFFAVIAIILAFLWDVFVDLFILFSPSSKTRRKRYGASPMSPEAEAKETGNSVEAVKKRRSVFGRAHVPSTEEGAGGASRDPFEVPADLKAYGITKKQWKKELQAFTAEQEMRKEMQKLMKASAGGGGNPFRRRRAAIPAE